MVFSRRYMLFAWLILMLSELVWTLWSLSVTVEPQLRQELMFRHVFVMLLLSFPLGFVLGGFLWWFVGFIGLRPSSELVEVFVMWTILAISGYLQWFELVPRFRQRLKSKTAQVGQRGQVLR